MSIRRIIPERTAVYGKKAHINKKREITVKNAKKGEKIIN
jgi:hypothetical protein